MEFAEYGVRVGGADRAVLQHYIIAHEHTQLNLV